MQVSVIESAAGSVIPTEAEGSRAVCGAQAQPLAWPGSFVCAQLPACAPRKGRDRSTALGITDMAGVTLRFQRTREYLSRLSEGEAVRRISQPHPCAAVMCLLQRPHASVDSANAAWARQSGDGKAPPRCCTRLQDKQG